MGNAKIFNNISNKFIFKNIENNGAQKICASTKDFIKKTYNSDTKTILDFLKNKCKKIKLRSEYDELYQYENVLIFRSTALPSQNLEQNLEFLKNDTIAPKLVQVFKLGEDDFITVLEACDSNLLPYSQNVSKIDNKVKTDFINKLKKLAQQGIINKEIYANKDALFTTPDYKKIVFADWSNINFLTNEEKKIYLEALDKFTI